jgi:hypothetical protein
MRTSTPMYGEFPKNLKYHPSRAWGDKHFPFY